MMTVSNIFDAICAALLGLAVRCAQTQPPLTVNERLARFSSSRCQAFKDDLKCADRDKDKLDGKTEFTIYSDMVERII